MLATAPAPPARVVPGAWNASILVGTHHKTGTVVLAKVFRVAARIIGVPRHNVKERMQPFHLRAIERTRADVSGAAARR